jgi:hypothetical protein
MRLVEVRDLLAGQSWYDMVQHRFLPPAGVASHWSRLLDAPLAAAIAALTPLLGVSLAERVTTAFWPPLLFLVYALVLVRGMRGLFGGRAAILAIFAATQTIGLAMQFAPARIDHHNVQIVLLLGLGLCLMQTRRSWRTGALAGALAAGSLAVGLEALPLVAIAGLIAVADWSLEGRPAMPALLGFGLGLALTATCLFGAQTAPALWGTSRCDALSPPWLWLAGLGAATGLAAAAVGPERAVARLGLALGVGLVGVAGFALLFPACLHGPFTDMPDMVRLRWLDRVREMQPITTLLSGIPAEGLGLTGALFAAAIASIVLAVTDRARRRGFTIASLFLAAGAIQTCFQMRGLYVASAFVPLIAGVCLDRALPVSAAPPVGRLAKAALVIAALALNAHVWLAVGRAGERLAKAPDVAQELTKQAEACTGPAAFRGLAALPAGTVLAPIDFGPYILAYTPHSIVAAPYHRAIGGLIAGIVVAEGGPDEIRQQAAAHHATYLALCPSPDETSFGARLAAGEATADWLDPIPLDGTAMKAWRIR